jgi:HEAT repeat protein
VRGAAADALASIGRDASSSVSALIAAMRVDSSVLRRQQYVRAIAATGPGAIPALVAALRDSKAEVRIGAAETLHKLSLSAARAVPEMIGELANDTEYQAQGGGNRTIGDDVAEIIADVGQPAATALQRATRDPRLPRLARIRAAIVLSRIRPVEEHAQVALLAEGFSDPKVRDDAADALGRMGTRVPEAVATLEGAAAQPGPLRFVASACLARIDPANRAVQDALQDLSAAMRHDNWRDRYEAVMQMARFGPCDVRSLAVALRDDHEMVRSTAVYGLGEIGAPARTAIPELIAYLKRADLKGQETDEIIRVMGRIGFDSDQSLDAIPILLKLLRTDFTGDVAVAVGRTGRAAVPELIRLLGDEDTSATKRMFVARALGRIGAEASDATLHLARTLADRRLDPQGEVEVIEAIGRIGPQTGAAVPTVVDCLNGYYAYAARALTRIGGAAVVPLVKAARSPDHISRVSALRALGELGPVAAPAVPALIEVAAAANMQERVLAIAALGDVGHDALSSESTLLKSLGDQHQEIRAATCAALGKIGANAPVSVRALVNALKDEALSVRVQAVEALGRIASPSPDVLSALDQLNKREQFVTVRVAVDDTVRRIMARATPSRPQ